jgi:hypothetical protein
VAKVLDSIDHGCAFWHEIGGQVDEVDDSTSVAFFLAAFKAQSVERIGADLAAAEDKAAQF